MPPTQQEAEAAIRTLIEYMGDDWLMVIDESHIAVPQVGGMFRGDRARKSTLVEFGFRMPSALDNRPLRFDEFEGLLKNVIHVSATPGNYEIEHSGDRVVEQVIRPTGLLDPTVDVRPAGIQVDDGLAEIRSRVAAGDRVLVTVLTTTMQNYDLATHTGRDPALVRAFFEQCERRPAAPSEGCSGVALASAAHAWALRDDRTLPRHRNHTHFEEIERAAKAALEATRKSRAAARLERSGAG